MNSFLQSIIDMQTSMFRFSLLLEKNVKPRKVDCATVLRHISQLCIEESAWTVNTTNDGGGIGMVNGWGEGEGVKGEGHVGGGGEVCSITMQAKNTSPDLYHYGSCCLHCSLPLLQLCCCCSCW